MKKKLLSISLILFACLCLYFLSILYQFFFTPLVDKKTIASIKMYPNESLPVVTDRLYQQKIISHPTFFQWLVELKGDRFQLRWGEYEIKYPMSASDLVNHMVKGTGLVKHRLTIVEGWTFSNILVALAKDDNLTHTLSSLTNQEILQKLNATQKHAEGLFYPNTFIFTWGNTDFSVLKMSYDKMQTLLQNDWNNRAPNLPYQNTYDALIVASLIERETAVAAEKPEIASVILNRLKKHMRLQVDPTVQYGLNKKFSEIITKKDLKTKTPYNTYLINGLPPTPICMPSESSILAALHPAQTDYLYYVATGTGGHNFSKTYAEHLKQVAQYRKISS